MHRLLPLLLIAFLATGLAACGDDEDEKTEKFTVDSKVGRTLVLEDNGRRGNSPGDERVFTQNLVDPESGDPVGRLDGTVTVTAQQRSAGRVNEYRVGTIQFTLDGGTLVSSGVYIADPESFVPNQGVKRPIVGGTGKYKGASGEVTQRPIAGGEIGNAFDIRLPD